MRKFYLSVIAALVGSMTFTACSSIEDNAVVPGDNLSGDIDMFESVKANEGDPAVVAALKSIESVAEVKPFINVGKDPDTALGQCYYIKYKQPVDHNNPALGTFEQQVVLTYVGSNAPTILHTEGYALAGSHGKNLNRLDSIDAPQFMYYYADPERNADGSIKFNTNCVQVEYRYHGFSLPEGDENSFKYLNTEQQSKDLHNIVSDLKKVLLKGKWLSTGVSKNGMTTYEYAYYFPGEMDVYVPFVAPLLYYSKDSRIGDYVVNKSVTDYLPQIKAAFQKCANDKTIYDAVAAAYKKKMETSEVKIKDDSLAFETMSGIINYLFKKQSYGDIEAWSKFIPKDGDAVDKYVDFFMMDENDPRILKKPLDARGPLRWRNDPFEMQIPVDIGNIGWDLSWVMDGKVFTDAEKKQMKDYMDNQRDKGSVTLDLSVKIADFLKTTDCKMFFVYGGNDPWTGGAIDDPTNENVKKLIIKNGTHNDYIMTYTADERKQLMDFVGSIIFPTSDAK